MAVPCLYPKSEIWYCTGTSYTKMTSDFASHNALYTCPGDGLGLVGE